MKKQTIFFIICLILIDASIATGQCSFTISSTNVLCHCDTNGTATVTPVTGTPPFSFIWNTTPPQNTATIINLAAGTYIVTVTDSIACSVTDSVTITQPDSLYLTLFASDDTICYGEVTILLNSTSGGTAPFIRSWVPNNMMIPPPPTYVCPPATLTYTLALIDNNGCTDTAYKTIVVDSCIVGIDQNNFVQTNISIYPNPATDKIIIISDNRQNMNLYIYNIVGKLVLQKELDKAMDEINIDSLLTGLYVIRITSASLTVQKTMIKE